MSERKFCRSLFNNDLKLACVYVLLSLMFIFIPYYTGCFILANTDEDTKAGWCTTGGEPRPCTSADEWLIGFILTAFCAFVFLMCPYYIIKEGYKRYWISDEECDGKPPTKEGE